MSGILFLRPGHRWKAVLLILAASAVILAGGVLVGYASGRTKGQAQQQPAPAAASNTEPKVQLTWLPLPGSEAAQQWLADPATPGWLRDVYNHHQDSLLITDERTEAFLKLLQHAMGTPAAAAPAPAPALSMPRAAAPAGRPRFFQQFSAARSKLRSERAARSTGVAVAADMANSSNTTGALQLCSPPSGLQPFITAAGDVLSYLRYKHSQALLDLLRGFSRDGLKGLTAFEANTTLLRQEVQQLLSPDSLQQWYLEAASSRVGAVSPADLQEAELLVGVGHLLHHSHRRMLSFDSGTLPFDLTTALLSKMQGTAPPAAAAAATFQASNGGGAAVGPAVDDAGEAEPAPAKWVPAKITITRPKAAPHLPGATAVADPGQLPYGLLDYDDSGEYGGVQLSSEGAEPAATPPSGFVGVTQPPRQAQDRNGIVPVGVDSSGRISDQHSSAAAHDSQGGTASPVVHSEAHPPAERAPQPAEAVLEQGWMVLQPVDSGDDDLQPEEDPQAAAAAPSSKQGQPLQQDAAEVLQGNSSPAGSGTGLAGVNSNSTNSSAAEDPFCSVQQFSPLRQQGGAAGFTGCSPWARLHTQASWGRRIITIPIIFHCLTFTKAVSRPPHVAAVPVSEAAAAHVVLPPNWHTGKAAVDLVDQANRAFFNTGIQFRLLEVRQDPTQHPYLQQSGLDAWQSCTYSPVRPVTGIACLHDVARRALPVPTHAVHVFVAGSRQERAYCGNVPTEVCRTLASGYSHAPGPWMGLRASPAWREESVADNWVWISWDTFNPATSNSVRFAYSGGSVFAAQLAQYLGLSAESAAAVVRTPTSSCSGSSQLPAMSRWCRAFRLGKKAPASQLPAPINSSATAFAILEPSVPDDCAMSFSASQVATLQAAVVAHRPSLLRAWIFK